MDPLESFDPFDGRGKAAETVSRIPESVIITTSLGVEVTLLTRTRRPSPVKVFGSDFI